MEDSREASTNSLLKDGKTRFINNGGDEEVYIYIYIYKTLTTALSNFHIRPAASY